MSAVYNSTVQGFYLSYYGRPADPAGLTFWTGQLAAAGGNLSAILNAFGTSAEATRRYGTGTDDSKIEAIYQQTFGRAADATGLAFYKGELAAGRITLIDISKRVIDGATGDDVTIRTNRLSAAQTFTDKLDTDAEKAGYSGSGAEDAARAWITTVTKDPATVTAAAATADSTITNLLPQSFALTINQDKWTGSAGNDSFSGGVTTLAATDTLGVTDQIDGGAGTDTANLTVTKSFNGFTVGTGFMKGVETVNLTNTTTSATSFSAKAVDGVSSYNVKGPVSVTGINSLTAKVSFSDLSAASPATILVSYADEIVTGSSDSATIGVNGLGRATLTTSAFDASVITLTAAGIETLTLDSAGANHIAIGAASANKALNFTGNGSLVMTTFGASSAIKTFDGSSGTGAQTVKFSNATNMTSIKTGSANDTIRVAAGEVRADAVIDAGSGTDTLEVQNSGGITAAWGLTGIETLRIRDGATGDLVLSPASVSGLKTIAIQESVGGTGHKITALGANEITVDLRAVASDVAATLEVENTAAAKVAISVGTATSEVTAKDSVTFTKATSLAVDVPLYAAYDTTGAITASKATSASLSGAGKWDHVTDGLVLPEATSLTINQQTSGASWNVGVSRGSTATTSALTDLNVTAVGTVTLSTVTGANAFQNVERLTVSTDGHFNGQGADTTLDNLVKATSVTLSGSKDASQVSLDDLGQTSNAYGLSVVATGLKAGFTALNAAVGSGQTLSVNVEGRTGSGDVSLGTMSVGSAYNKDTSPLTGSITLSGKGSASTGSLVQNGNVYAAAVTLDASGSSYGTGSSEAVTFGGSGTITGNTVVIKSSAAPVAFNVGSITVKDSLTFEGSAVVRTNGGSGTVAISALDTSTNLSVALTGGVAVDAFTIAGSSAQSSITVTGDLKADTDTLSITSTSGSTSGQTIDVTGLASTNVTIVSGDRADTIKGSAGNDTITGRSGADSIDISQGGNDTVVLRSPIQDTGSVSIYDSSGTLITTGILDGSTAFATNQYVLTTGLDKVTGFGSGDIIRVNSADYALGDASSNTYIQKFGQKIGKTDGASASATGNTLDGTALTTANAYDVFVLGNFDSGTSRFTFNSSGKDTLYLLDDGGTSGATAMYGVVLVGYVLAAAAESGSGTGLVGVAS